MIMLLILTTSFRHFCLKGWENVLFCDVVTYLEQSCWGCSHRWHFAQCWRPSKRQVQRVPLIGCDHFQVFSEHAHGDTWPLIPILPLLFNFKNMPLAYDTLMCLPRFHGRKYNDITIISARDPRFSSDRGNGITAKLISSSMEFTHIPYKKKSILGS